MITDKVMTENGADFTFVCGKVPFAVSCSTSLPHRSSNMMDLDLVNKMKIPLKNIRVTRISIQGHDLRCVGVISQTIQCVADGKISGTIHLYAKVVRDLYAAISTDCLASRTTFSRLMGHDPPTEPPDNPTTATEVLGGDDDDDEENVITSDAEGADVRDPDAKGENVRDQDDEGENVPDPDDEEENVPSPEVKRENAQEDPRETPSSRYEDEECLDIVKGIPDYCYDRTPYDEKTLYPDKWEECYDSDGNYDPVLTDFVNNDYPTDVYYQGGKLHKMKRRNSPQRSKPRRGEEKHCQFCFLSGQPIKVTISHNDMDIECTSMSDVDRVRIHGEAETNKWLARQYGYHD